MKKIYYVVEKELNLVGEVEETTGWKDVRLYEILNDDLFEIGNFELSNSDNTEISISDYLVDNLHFENKNNFKLIQL